MHTQCDNCNAEWIQNAKFCYQCGQDHHRMPINFKHFVLEFLESTLHFETKNFRMVKLLFTNPGLIIKEYNENKRARYVNPLRLYIFLGFIFFLTTNFQGDKKSQISISINNTDSSNISQDEYSDTYKNHIDSIFEVYKGNLNYKRVDSIAQSNNMDLSFMEKIRYVNIDKAFQNRALNESTGELFLKYVNKSLLILIPLFAFVLLLLLGYKKNYYQSTLIFALYLHCLIYILLSVKNIINLISDRFEAIFYLSIFFYLIYTLKVAFDLKWRRSIFKALSLSFIYLILLGLTSIGILFYITLIGA